MMNHQRSTKHTQPTNKGFTLIETLFAIVVLITAIGGPLAIASEGLFATRVAQDQVVATYLAQEAIEYIRNVRDTNLLSGESDWLDGLGPCTSGSCIIDVSTDRISACSGACDVMRYNDSTGTYGYWMGSNFEDTRFTRTITITIIENREAEIVVDITWPVGVITKSFQMRENLLNWD